MKIYHKITGKLLFDVDRSDLHGLDLRCAGLRGLDLRWANFRGADIHNTNFRGLDLRETDFCDADLRDSDFRGVNFCDADLRGANFRNTDLRWADFRGANVQGVLWPAPTEVLLANWGMVSDDLTRDLMVFDQWVNGGQKIPKNPLELMDRLLLECCIGHVPSCNWAELTEETGK